MRIISLVQSNDTVNDVSIFILLPNETTGLEYLEEYYDRIEVRKLRERGHFRFVDMELPKLQLSSNIPLQEPLTKVSRGDVSELSPTLQHHD